MVLINSLGPSVVLHGHDLQEVKVQVVAKAEIVEWEPAPDSVAYVLEDLGTVRLPCSHTHPGSDGMLYLRQKGALEAFKTLPGSQGSHPRSTLVPVDNWRHHRATTTAEAAH